MDALTTEARRLRAAFDAATTMDEWRRLSGELAELYGTIASRRGARRDGPHGRSYMAPDADGWREDAAEAAREYDAAARAKTAALERIDALIARLLQAVESSPLDQVEISVRAGQRPGWLADLMQAWRGARRRGREPTISTLRLLAQGLGMTLGELLGAEILDR